MQMTFGGNIDCKPLSVEQRYLFILGIIRHSMVSPLKIFILVEFFFLETWNFLTIDHWHDLYFLPFFFHGCSQLELEERLLRRGGGYGGSFGPSTFSGTFAFPLALSDSSRLDPDLLRYPKPPRTAKQYQESSCHLWCNPQVRCQFQWDLTAPTLSRLGIRIPQPARPGPVDTST